MSWVPVNKGQPHSTYCQDSNLISFLHQPAYGLNEQVNHFLDDLSTPLNDHNGLNLIFDPHLNHDTFHLQEFPAPAAPLDQEHNNGNLGLGPCLAPSSNPCQLLGDSLEVPEIPDTCFNYITELLRDDNPEEQPLGCLQDYMAYQTCYQSLIDTLSGGSTTPPPPPPPRPQQSSNQYQSSLPSSSSDHCNHQTRQDTISSIFFTSSSHGSNSFVATEDCFLESESNLTNPCLLESSLAQFPLLQQALLPPIRPNSSNPETLAQNHPKIVIPESYKTPGIEAGRATDPSINMTIGRKHLHSQEGDGDEERRSKQNLTACPETYDQISEFEQDIFCPEGKYENPSLCNQIGSHQSTETGGDQKLEKKNNRGKNKKQGTRRRKPEVVDLMSLLINCAESVSRMDIATARDQLKLIRQHASPYGDSIQRISHYLADGLEQRLSGAVLHPPYNQISATEFLKANRIYVAAVPFKIMSIYVSNKTIHHLASSSNSTSIHIIDFGISYGLQWPCIIYNLSKVEPTPPKLRITGIDFPESGFRPAHRLEETGRCLKKYSQRFNLQFEYNAIVAESWESVKPEEIDIRRDEFTVVNSLYRSHHLYDESVEESSPRDEFLELVRRIRPQCFVHGVVNGNLNGPFFITRFKEAVSHFAAFFEVFESTMAREDGERAVLEGKVFGESARNAVACEGRERVERTETYRRWAVRKARAGFRQVPLERELMRRAKAMVKRSFRKEFMMEEDCGWAVQGWKGRILYAVSCWRPA